MKKKSVARRLRNRLTLLTLQEHDDDDDDDDDSVLPNKHSAKNRGIYK